jgi:signal transduction histidine kinase
MASGDPTSIAARLFAGPGEMRERCRGTHWAATPLGAVETWPAALRTAVRMMLAAPVATSLWCGPSYTLVYNDGYRRILGVKHPDALARSGAQVWDELWPALERQFEDVRAGGPAVYEDESRLVMERLEGGLAEEAWFTYSLSALTDDDGACLAVYNVAVEVTGRVHAQRALRNERERLFEAFQRVPSFVSVVTGPRHVLEYANEAYYTLVGRRDILGKPVWEALPDARGQGFEVLLDGVRDTGEPFVGREAPLALARTPGAPPEQRYVDFVYQALTDADGTRWGVMGYGTDVTESVWARQEVERLLAESERANEQLQEQAAELEAQTEDLQSAVAEMQEKTEEAEEARRESQAARQRLLDLFDQAPVAVAVLTGPDHVYSIISPRYARFIPRGRAALGMPFREAVPEIEGQGLAELMDRVYQTGEPFFMHERLVRLDYAGDGVLQDRWFDIGYQPLRDATGAVYAIASVSQDITAHVLARREVEAARAAAEQANQAKTDFLATMSHELRTPLNAIAGYTELLEIGIHGPVTSEQRDALLRIQRSQRHLLGLINDVLNFAKLEAGHVEFAVADVRVCDVVDALEPLVAPQLRARALRYDRTGCRDDGARTVQARADAEKLQQVLVNLLSNAIKFTAPGGQVAVRCHAEGDRVQVRVEDTGIGIAPDRLEHVFDPFVQVDRRLNAPHEGTGLGLAISRDLARGMGGDLTVESTLGVGSTFTLTLPATTSAPGETTG